MPTDYDPTPAPLVKVQVPSDGDDDEAAAWNPAVESLADAIAYYRGFTLKAEASATLTPAGDPPYANTSSTASTAYSSPALMTVTIPDLNEGDLVLVYFVVSLVHNDGGVGAFGVCRAMVSFDGAAAAQVPGAKFSLQPDVVAARCVTLSGRVVVPAPGIPGDTVTVAVSFEYKVTNVAASLAVNGFYSLGLVAGRFTP